MSFRNALLAAVLGLAAIAPAQAALDVVQSPTSFFVPTDAQKYDSPYYRNQAQDWGWTHGVLTAPTTSATLSISAFDVDFAQGERDLIEAYDAATTSWISLGYLTGANDAWAFTDFALP
ncbi:MAG: hypothetical protein K2X74_12645, partial [Acetobacteraceae bacterium]|nr:hypothetical protein [Acetobacteraceae bacterium]